MRKKFLARALAGVLAVSLLPVPDGMGMTMIRAEAAEVSEETDLTEEMELIEETDLAGETKLVSETDSVEETDLTGETEMTEEADLVEELSLTEEMSLVETAGASEETDPTEASDPARAEDQTEAEDQTSEIDFIVQAVRSAMEATKAQMPALESEVLRDFLKASNAYDGLEDPEKEKLPKETRNDLLTVQERIGKAIHACEGVTATGGAWYVKTNVSEGDQQKAVLKALKDRYEGSAPDLIYYKNVSYTDIRSDTACQPSVSVTFPVPKGYDRLASPHVLTYMGGKLYDVSPVRQEDGFYVRSARLLNSIIIVDTPVALTGLKLKDAVSINRGQKTTLKVTPLPEGVTESYTLRWTSSDPATARVNSSGVVTGKSAGSCTVTVSVKGREDIKPVTCRITVVEGAHALATSVEKVLKETKAYMLSTDTSPTIGSEWFVLGLARGGMKTSGRYFKTYYNHLANYLAENGGKLTGSAKYTEYSKTIVALTAMGKDAADVGGYNLFEPLADMDRVTAQGINGPIWALIALNCSPDYKLPKVSGVSNRATERKYIDYILENETPEGGWSLNGTSPDPDLTGMAFQAFAPYYKKKGYEDVTAAVDRALETMSGMQNATGGFSSWGTETEESCVQMITGLCALGIDPETDERFVKGGAWLVENLLSYHISGSGFMHVRPGSEGNGGGEAGEVNGMATEQGYYALVAYQRLKAGKTALCDMSDLKVAAGGKGDGKGTGMEAPDTDTSKKPEASSGSSGTGKTPGAAANAAGGTSGGSPAVSSGSRNSRIRTSIGTSASPGRSLGAGAAAITAASRASGTGKTLKGVSTAAKKGNDTKKGSKVVKDEAGEGGWSFTGADAGLEPVAVLDTAMEEPRSLPGPGTTGSLPPLAMGLLGGLLGFGGMEGGRYLYGKKKGKKGDEGA